MVPLSYYLTIIIILFWFTTDCMNKICFEGIHRVPKQTRSQTKRHQYLLHF